MSAPRSRPPDPPARTPDPQPDVKLGLGSGKRPSGKPSWISGAVEDDPWVMWRALPRTAPYLRPHRGRFVISTLLSIGAAALLLAEPWPLALILDSVLGPHPAPGPVSWLLGGGPGTYLLLGFAVGARFLLIALVNLVNLLSDYLNTKVEQNMVLDFRSHLFGHVQGLSLSFHDRRLTGQLMSLVNNTAASLGEIVM